MTLTVYKITHHLADNKKKLYIGVTCRTLEDRLRAHFNESTREKPRGLSHFSLGYAIREQLEHNKSDDALWKSFEIATLENYRSVQEMLDGEGFWIDEFDTMAPHGYNLMRGGSSAGGPSNSKPCEIFLDGSLQKFTSIQAATEAVAKFMGITDEKQVSRFKGRVRTRMNCKDGPGWTFAAALDLEPREDLRTTERSRTAKQDKENLDTVRSRDYRRLKAEKLENVGKVETIPHPNNLSETVSIKEAAKLLNIAKSTLRWRLDQIRPKIETMAAKDIIAHLETSQTREKQFHVTLPSGEEINAGHNALAAQFSRQGHSVSAIKSRLRKLGPAPTNDDLLVAIGKKERPDVRKTISFSPISRKKHCDNWTISFGQNICQFTNQAEFVRACADLLMSTRTDGRYLGREPHDIVKVERHIQDVTRRMTKKGATPEQIADHFEIRETLSKYR